MFLFLFLMAILLNNFYTSCVVSFLLENKASPINSIRELADSRLKLGLENLPYNQVIIEVQIYTYVYYVVSVTFIFSMQKETMCLIGNLNY